MTNETHRPKVLLVDDRKENLFALEQMLGLLEVDLYSALSGNEALALTLHHNFALALLDVQMPEMDGFELAAILRENENTEQLPIIFITAISKEDRYVSQGYATGAVDYIFKPVDTEILRGKVRVFIELFEQRQALARENEERQRVVAELHQKQEALKAENARREALEKAAQENAIRYRALAELSPVGIVTIFEEKIAYVNTATLKLLGIDQREALLEQKLSAFCPPESKAILEAYLEKIVRQGGQQEAIELPFEAADGASTPCLVQGAGFFSSGQIGIQLALQDITLRKALEEELRRLSQRDGLTGIANRRTFDEILAREKGRSRRSQTSLGLILMDIDSFKAYNDHYGHQCGDEALKAVAQSIQESVHRATDLVARYGGEEFVAVLPDTDLPGAQRVAERMRAAVRAREIAHAHSPADAFLTLSLGVAAAIYTEENEALDLVALADKALYAAKEQGRNRVVSADELTQKA